MQNSALPNLLNNTLFEYLAKGGPVMIPLGVLSIATLACTLERMWFWVRFLIRENKIVRDVLDASRYSLEEALKVAHYARHQPIGRFLLAPLSLKRPTPETFRLALETSGDREFIQMRKGDKLLETIVAVAPLLGLLGTVTGLIITFDSLNIEGGASSEAAGKAAAGIGEALLTTAAGMVVAICALFVLRILVTLQTNQQDYFSQVGGELELIYRQVWYEPLYSKQDHESEKEELETSLSLEQR